MLLDLSGLTREERVLVKASINNERDFDRPSLLDIHVFVSEKVSDEQRAKAKTGQNVETLPALVGFAEKARANTLAAENLEQSAYYAICTSVEDYDYGDDTTEPADAYQAHNVPADPGTDEGEEILDDVDDDENETVSSYVALDDVTALEAAELDAIALLADTWDCDLDPEVSAQLVQANVQACLCFGKRERKMQRQEQGQCLLPARQRKTRRVQLVWQHDSVFTTKRVRTGGYVSSSTSTVTIPRHTRMWTECTSADGKDRTDIPDPDSFRHHRHQEYG